MTWGMGKLFARPTRSLSTGHPFRVGQQIVCIAPTAKGVWYDLQGGRPPVLGPSFRDICVVSAAWVDTDDGEPAIDLVGFPVGAGYSTDEFRPLVNSKQTEEADVALFKPALSPDPVLIADLYERDMTEIEAALNRTDFP